MLVLNESSFGALRKAQRILDRTHEDPDDEDESDGSSSTEGQQSDDSTDEEGKPEDEVRVKGPKRVAAIAARKSKHA